MDFISVVLCTFNRSADLLEALHSLREMDVPDDVRWEVLVVDNNSSDDTAAKVREFIGNDPHFKYFFEPHQGKTYALNQGIRNARGDILAFTDDDALVNKDWVASIVSTFNQYDATCVGGRVLPVWGGARPGWLTDNLLNVLAILDYGDRLFEFDWATDDRMLFGVNFAFKRDYLIGSGLFKAELLSRCEDRELFERLVKTNEKAVYNPHIVVHHKVSQHRLNKAYFRKWHYDTGQAAAAFTNDYPGPTILGIPGYMFRRSLSLFAGYIKSVITFNFHGALIRWWSLIYYYAFMRRRIENLFH